MKGKTDRKRRRRRREGKKEREEMKKKSLAGQERITLPSGTDREGGEVDL